MFGQDKEKFFKELDFGQIFWLEEEDGSICGYKFTKLRLNKTYQGNYWTLFGISGKTQAEEPFFRTKANRLTKAYTQMDEYKIVDTYNSIKGADFKPYIYEVFARLWNKYNSSSKDILFATSVGENNSLHKIVWQWRNNKPVERYMAISMDARDSDNSYIEISKNGGYREGPLSLFPTSLLDKGADFSKKYWDNEEECVKENTIVVYDNFGEETPKYNIGDNVCFYYEKSNKPMKGEITSMAIKSNHIEYCIKSLGPFFLVKEHDIYFTI